MYSKMIAAIGTLVLLAACDANLEQMEADKLDSFELTDRERAVADALVEGYKKEMKVPVLRSRDYMRAACYAQSVEMPSRHDAVHVAYLRDYPAIDADFYRWFANRGYSEQDAWTLSQRVQKGYADCSIGALVKKRFSNK